MSEAAKDIFVIILALCIGLSLIILSSASYDVYMTNKGFVWVPQVSGHWELPKN